MGSEAVKGRLPVTISYSVTPTAIGLYPSS
jgi:hypothetical protein